MQGGVGGEAARPTPIAMDQSLLRSSAFQRISCKAERRSSSSRLFSFSAALIASRTMQFKRLSLGRGDQLVAKQEISFSKQRHGRAMRASHSDEGGLELVPGLGAVDKRQAGIHSNFGKSAVGSRAAGISLTTALIPQCFGSKVTLFRFRSSYERHESSERDA